MLPNPVIVVPGITGSDLRDEYPVDPENVWSAVPVLGKKFERIALHPDNRRYERKEPARVRPSSVFELPYAEMIEQLRYELTKNPLKPVPVFPFAYDWRQPLADIENELAQFIDEVIDRTALLRHYNPDVDEEAPDPIRVNLVGHSMGGLIIAGYMTRGEAKQRVYKVASVASPFRGSIEAPVKIVTGSGTLEPGEDASREREAARVTPSLYHLLPDKSLVHADNNSGSNLFERANWQPSLLETLESYVRLYSVRNLNEEQIKDVAETIFDEMLATSAAYRERYDIEDLIHPDRWLCIVGVHDETRVRLSIKSDENNGPEFDIEGAKWEDGWESDKKADRVKTGDGTVPYLGARCAFLDPENIVCVTPGDFSIGEITDQVLYRSVGFHAILPKMNLVHRLIVSHFRGEPERNTWGRKAPDIKRGTKWNPPIKGLKPRK